MTTDAVRVRGRVDWFVSKSGYGFVLMPDGRQAFAHYSFINMEGYKTLSKGQEVEFTPVQTDRGLQAHDIVVLDK